MREEVSILQITLSQQVQLKDFRKGYVNIYKIFESNVIPHKGDFIADSCFKDPYEYEVVEVIINYQENTCYVQLNSIIAELNDKQVLKNYVEMAELHGWECNTKEYL